MPGLACNRQNFEGSSLLPSGECDTTALAIHRQHHQSWTQDTAQEHTDDRDREKERGRQKVENAKFTHESESVPFMATSSSSSTSSSSWRKRIRERERQGKKDPGRGRYRGKRAGTGTMSRRAKAAPARGGPNPLHLFSLLHSLAADMSGGNGAGSWRDSTTCAGFFSSGSESSSRTSSFNLDEDGRYQDGIDQDEEHEGDAANLITPLATPLPTPRSHASTSEAAAIPDTATERSLLSSCTSWSSSSSSSSVSTTSSDSDEWSEWEDDPMWVKDDLLLHPPRSSSSSSRHQRRMKAPPPPKERDDPPSDETEAVEVPQELPPHAEDSHEDDAQPWETKRQDREGNDTSCARIENGRCEKIGVDEPSDASAEEEEERPRDDDDDDDSYGGGRQQMPMKKEGNQECCSTRTGAGYGCDDTAKILKRGSTRTPRKDRVWRHKSGVEALVTLAGHAEELQESSHLDMALFLTTALELTEVDSMPSETKSPSVEEIRMPSEEKVTAHKKTARAKIVRALTRRRDEEEDKPKSRRRNRHWRWSQQPKGLEPISPVYEALSASSAATSTLRSYPRRDILTPRPRPRMPDVRVELLSPCGQDSCTPDMQLIREMIEEQTGDPRRDDPPTIATGDLHSKHPARSDHLAAQTSTVRFRITRPDINNRFQSEPEDTQPGDRRTSQCKDSTASDNCTPEGFIPLQRSHSPKSSLTAVCEESESKKEEKKTAHRKRSSSALARLCSDQATERRTTGFGKLGQLFSRRNRVDGEPHESDLREENLCN